MNILNKYKVLLIVVLIIVLGLGALFFFYRLYQRDMQTLEDFVAAYEKFDKAIDEFSSPIFVSNPEAMLLSNDPEKITDEAQAELATKASARISSLIKNDAKAMSAMVQIADLSGKELDAVKAFKSAISNKNADLGLIANEVQDLKIKRQTAFADFLELGKN